ncbi:F-box protein SKIP16 isoform X3 [Macadamia integrifolia]|uniref:F-box protein SKIP16 isoform X3 n=1 Tax=Macadamia integrifolia TaxID=60698 RepID=UPI001C4EF58A|nr:F-box protein SKIP16 isoform X3 [Macadamia integrifolia]
MGLEDLGDLALHLIMSKLDAKEAAILSCVNKRLRVSASEERLWRKFCADDLDLLAPEDPDGNTVPSFKAAYQIWRKVFIMSPWLLIRRVKRCWNTIKSWMAANFPEAGGTLRKGASEAEIKEMEDTLGVKLPLPTKVLYRFCDGQDITSVFSSGSERGSSLGLIGGYSFYDHVVNVYLLPLSQVIAETKEFVRHLGFSNRSKYIVVAASSTYGEKLFFLNCSNAQLYVGTKNLSIDGEMIACVPSTLINSVHNFHGNQQQDAMLLWLEEHGRRLHSGIIGLRGEGDVRSINLFPESPPLCSTAATNGVQTRASSLLIPELCDPQKESEKYWFSYSIRMRLLPEGCIINGTSFGSCQLYWRRWIIRANDTVISDVNDEAVIGKYPLLYPDGKEFVYESCTPLTSSSGSIEGAFTFVPGRLTEPKGMPFDVKVARFLLKVPDYVF